MSGVQTEISPADTHTQDMASWKEGDISRASKKAKRRYFLYKAAIKAYKDARDHVPTGDVVDTIARRYDLSVEMIEQLAKRCAMLHAKMVLPGVFARWCQVLYGRPPRGMGLGPQDGSMRNRTRATIKALPTPRPPPSPLRVGRRLYGPGNMRESLAKR